MNDIKKGSLVRFKSEFGDIHDNCVVRIITLDGSMYWARFPDGNMYWMHKSAIKLIEPTDLERLIFGIDE